MAQNWLSARSGHIPIPVTEPQCTTFALCWLAIVADADKREYWQIYPATPPLLTHTPMLGLGSTVVEQLSVDIHINRRVVSTHQPSLRGSPPARVCQTLAGAMHALPSSTPNCACQSPML